MSSSALHRCGSRAPVPPTCRRSAPCQCCREPPRARIDQARAPNRLITRTVPTFRARIQSVACATPWSNMPRHDQSFHRLRHAKAAGQCPQRLRVHRPPLRQVPAGDCRSNTWPAVIAETWTSHHARPRLPRGSRGSRDRTWQDFASAIAELSQSCSGPALDNFD